MQAALGLPAFVKAVAPYTNLLRGRPDQCRRLQCYATAAVRVVKEAFIVPTETAMEEVAALWATERHPGDVYLLSGDVGAGKSVFSRAFIRHACDDEDLPVPSPTFLLLNSYPEVIHGPPINHYDLYRLSPGSNLQRLGLDTAFQESVCLVEWPERLHASETPGTATRVKLLTIPEELRDKLLAILNDGQRKHLERVADAADEEEAGAYQDNRWRLAIFSSSCQDLSQRMTKAMQTLDGMDVEFVRLGPLEQMLEMEQLLRLPADS